MPRLLGSKFLARVYLRQEVRSTMLHGRFIAVIASLCLMAIALPFVITSTQLYCHHSQVYWDAADCYKFSVRDQTADIVFVGDSSLVYGVRPRILRDELHLSSYNLGLPAGVMLFEPRLLLDRYLAQNRRPRLIVLYLGPWTYIRHQAELPRLWIDSARVAVRHGSPTELAGIFLSDPRRLLQYPSVFYQQGWAQFSAAGTWWHQGSEEMEAESGWLAFWRPGQANVQLKGWLDFWPAAVRPEPADLPDNCALEPRPVEPDPEPIEVFRHSYEAQGMRVAVFIAPVPSCDPSYKAIVAAYGKIADNHPSTLPGRYFIDDGWRVHMTAAGAELATRQVAQFIGAFAAARSIMTVDRATEAPLADPSQH